MLCCCCPQAQAARCLLQLGGVFWAAGDAAGALPYALSAALQCHQLDLATLAADAVLLVSQLWRALVPGGSGWALAMLQEMLPLAATVGNVKLQAQLQMAAVETWLESISSSSMQGSARLLDGDGCQMRGLEALGVGHVEVQEWLHASAAGFTALSMWEEAERAWQLLALLCRVLKQVDRGDLAAAFCLSVVKKAQGEISC